MSPLPIAAGVLDRARASLGDALPGLAGALVLLVVGLLLAWLVGRVAAQALGAVGLEALAERAGLLDVLSRGSGSSARSRGSLGAPFASR